MMFLCPGECFCTGGEVRPNLQVLLQKSSEAQSERQNLQSWLLWDLILHY